MATVEETILIREMTPDDVNGTVELSYEQEWPHRHEDWEIYLALGEGLVAESEGRIVGTTMAWRYAPTFATLGMVIVANEFQGRGLGRRMMEAMLGRLAGCTVLLNATEAGAPLYRKFGFEPLGRIHQHQGTARMVPLAQLRPGERVRPLGGADSDLAHLYDRATGMGRGKLFESLGRSGSAVVLAQDHVPVGFANMRRFGRGWSVGPIVAPDLAGAKALASHWIGAYAGSFCRLDVPADSGFSEWLEEIGLPKVGEVHTMVRGTAPVFDERCRLFGLVSQALG
ncbi:GNAT family N-acetyltransferase [Novosphingobium aerophilum]|uniref:GNAT family N-acetyltransferase n=1 Tax=Novosphingobium TaxID=165696 RepID=UPI002D798FB7|nr:GNAT family N-acetyltransferase [Novosphingobium sp. RL4]WRT96073.1 GNAT family N-acetyltransferase [Novosphingobium sp. RL4]